jgi:hypothetical protein
VKTQSGARSSASGGDGRVVGNGGAGSEQGKTLFIKLRSEDCPEYDRLKLIHMMFPGHSRMVIHFSDTRKNVATSCVIHDALVRELSGMLGEENVVVR